VNSVHIKCIKAYRLIRFEDNDGDHIAHFAELPGVSACGCTAEEAISELKVAWETMKISYKKHGEDIPLSPTRKEYSGQFNVRIDRRIHRALAVEAVRFGVILNALVAQKLSQSVSRQIDTDI
jgi:predicted HicB family RNase H-like nuclease